MFIRRPHVLVFRSIVSRLACVLVVTCIVATGCASDPVDPATATLRTDLDAAIARWDDGDRSDYSYIYLRTCKCERPEPQGPNTVFVVDGSVAKIEHFGLREFLDGFTAEELFARIGQALDDGNEVAATYDPETGLPTSFNLDVNADEAADPLILDIHSFLSYADARVTLADARDRWEASDIGTYRLQYEADDPGIVQVDVVGDSVPDHDNPSTEGRNTVADLFDEIEAAIDQRPDTLTVFYDPTLGYPTSYEINIDLSQRGKIDVRSIQVTE